MLIKAIVIILLMNMFVVPLVVAQNSGTGSAEALSYLKSRQNSDGGFSEPGESSELRLTCWVLLAVASADQNALSWATAGKKTDDFMSIQADKLVELEDIELSVIALAESGSDPRNISGNNLVSLINANIDENGKIGKILSEHCYGIIALACAGEKISTKVIGKLTSQQREDGGWGESGSVVISTTALAIQAMSACGEADTEIVRKGLKYLRNNMNGDGGFIGKSGVSEGQLTALAAMAVYSAGDNPKSDEWTFQGKNPVGFLGSLQKTDGHFQFSKSVESQPAFTTSISFPAMKGKYLFLKDTVATNTNKNALTGDPLHDLGAAGANIKAENQPFENDQDDNQAPGFQNGVNEQLLKKFKTVSIGTYSSRTTWFNGFWLFLIVCISYFTTLCIIAIVAKWISSIKRSSYFNQR